MFYCEEDLLANLVVLSPNNARKQFRIKIFEEWQWGCAYCGKSLTDNTATIDHIIPKSKGGHNVKSNMCCCCSSCNREKGSQQLDDWYVLKNPNYCEQRLGKIKTWMDIKASSFKITSIDKSKPPIANEFSIGWVSN